MRNALLPVVSSQIYNFGNSEVQIPNLDVFMSLDSKIFSFDQSVHGDGTFHLDSKIFHVGDDQLPDGVFGLPFQSYINEPPVVGYYSASSNCDVIEEHQPLMQRKNEFVDPWVQLDFQARQLKMLDDAGYMLPTSGMGNLVRNGMDSGELRTNKRKRSNPFEEQYWRHQVKEFIKTTERKTPARRSQKLSDRITALQKLVSPYGKTDTAAVLQEAVLHIKLLQDQIQNLFQTPRSSHCTLNNEIDGQAVDLKSRGLCLVPVSLTRSVALQEDATDPDFFTGESILAGEV